MTDHSHDGARDDVRESEERYRAFIQNSSVGIWRLEFDPPIDTSLPVDEQVALVYERGRYAECNDTMARMYALPDPSGLVGRSLDFMLPSSDPGARAYIASIVEAGYQAVDVESTEVDATGAVKHFLNNITGVISDGRLRRVWGTQRDISDRKAAELALRESENRAAAAQAYLAAIIDSADDAIISKDLNGVIQSCNAAAERLFGYSARELVGRPVRILIPADRQWEEDDILARLRRGERIEHFETIRVAKDGRLLNISLTVSPVRDATGTVIGASKIARDITEQKRSASAQAAEQAWFRTTLASIADAVIATDVSGRIVFMNAVAERLTGTAAADAQGSPISEVFRIVDEAERRPIQNAIEHLTAAGRASPLPPHVVLLGPDGGERPIDQSGAPIRTRDGKVTGAVLVFRDVSERRRIERDRQAAAEERERLLESERLARAEAERASRVKDDFVAMVSHELRTPLNAILGWTQLMMRNRKDPATIERGLDIVSRNTRLQAQLISDLLDISRIVSGKLQIVMQPVDATSIVSDAIETLRSEAEAKGVALEVRLEPVGVIVGDPARLQQVVWNVLANAVKFTPAQGRVSVTLARRGDVAEVVVSDKGAGIRADVLPYIFDRFHQADRSITRRFGGLGLGLSIVKHLVELHGGTVRAESAGPGLGATFTIGLPLSAAPLAHEERPPAGDVDPAAAVSLDALRILVVEDEPDTREFLRRLLAGHGAAVSTAASAQEALELFQSSPPDVLISDIGLPGTDGYDLIQRIRATARPGQSAVPAIALTAYARAEDRVRALEAGYQAHLAKPVEPGDLLTTVAGVAASGQRQG